MPTVSVLMLCYNHEKYVGEAIRSVLAQSYTDFEFLMVDNGCTDNSYEVMRSFDDERIRIFRLEQNDPDNAMSLMCRHQTGKYIAAMCSDDVWEPDKLMRQVTALEEHPDYRVSATWAVLFSDEDANMLEWSREFFAQPKRSRLQWMRHLLDWGNCLSLPSLVAESDLYKRCIGVANAFWQLTDYHQWLMILKETNIYMVEEVLVKQRFHTANANISSPSRENDIRMLTERSKILLYAIDNLSDKDFKEMYADRMMNPGAQTHLEILCEKLFVLLGYAKENPYYEENVLYYFYKYYSYGENGVYVVDVLREKYQYSRVDFKNISANMGYVARCERQREKNELLLAKLRHFLPDDVKEVLKDIGDALDICIAGLQTGNSDAELFEKLLYNFDRMLGLWETLSYMEIAVDKDEMELCRKICTNYRYLTQEDLSVICGSVVQFRNAVQELLI